MLFCVSAAILFAAAERLISPSLVNNAVKARYRIAGFFAPFDVLGKQIGLLQSSPVFSFQSFELSFVSLQAMDGYSHFALILHAPVLRRFRDAFHQLADPCPLT